MTQIKAEILADSVSPDGNRITTYLLRYPRFIHAELLTHRVFARNSASSRAIPIARSIETVRNDPVLPEHMGRNQKGMQAGEDVSQGEAAEIRESLALLGSIVAEEIEALAAKYNLHKQVLNRYMEPWLPIETILTGTDFDGFFIQRCHPAAEPHMQELARQMQVLRESNTPEYSATKHLPHASSSQEISAARCARVSYGRVSQFDSAADLALYDRLVADNHLSPLEHPCVAAKGKHGPYTGWRSLRHQIYGEGK